MNIPAGRSQRARFILLRVPAPLALVGLCAVIPCAQGQLIQQGAKLTATGSVGTALQGTSVAVSGDGNTAIVGGPGDDPQTRGSTGAVWIFSRSVQVWTQQGSKLVGTGAIGAASQGVSTALSADGNTAIVGGPFDNWEYNKGSTGAVWVFTRSGDGWTQQGTKLVGTGAVDRAQQGISVAVSGDGNTAIVGGLSDNGSIGAAWVFTRSGGVDPARPQISGHGFGGSPQQGLSVAISREGNTAMIGGPYDNNFTGAVWVFTRSDGVWTQQGAKLVGTGAVGNALQGNSVSASGDGNTAMVGGNGDSGNIGAAWVYARSRVAWTQQGDKLVGTGAIGSAIKARRC